MNFHPCDVSHIDHFDWKLPTKVTDATIESVYEFLKQLIKYSLSIFPKFNFRIQLLYVKHRKKSMFVYNKSQGVNILMLIQHHMYT